MKKLLFILSLFIAINANAQLAWEKKFTYFNVNKIIQTGNGDFIFAGSQYIGMLDEWGFARLNPAGNLISDTSFIYGCATQYADLKATDDSGYIAIGTVESINVLRFDKNDHLLWGKNLLNDQAIATSITLANDSGFIITGISSNGSFVTVFFLKINEQGDSVWKREYINGTYTYGKSITNALDSGYVCLCSGQFGIRLLKVNEQGDSIWANNIGQWHDDGFSINKTNDSCYIIGGMSADNHVLFIKTDKFGNQIWRKTFVNPYASVYTVCKTVVPTFDNGFIAACRIDGSGSFSEQLPWSLILKLNSNGDSAWSIFINSTSSAEDIIQSADSMYVFAGEQSMQFANRNAWIIKFDSLTNPIVGLTGNTVNTRFANFPNPFTSSTFFEFNDRTPINGTLDIFDTYGKLIFSKAIKDQNRFEYSPTRIAQGIYFYRLVINNIIYAGKMIKQ